MNCEEVSKHLTEYLDKTLDTAMTTRVATHVISCALCRAESRELADCVKQVANLPSIDPPLGFAQRVMAHVHDMEPKPSLWQRLMMPVIGRVPVRATALALVAISAIALYQKEQPLKRDNDVNLALRSEAQTQAKIKEPPLTKSVTIAPPKERKTDPKNTATVNHPAPIAPLARAAASTRAESSVGAQPQQLKTPATTPLTGQKVSSEDLAIVAPKRPPLRVQDVTAARDSGFMFGETRGLSAPPLPAPLAVLRQSAPLPIPMALERTIPLSDRVADFEFIVRRRAPQRRDRVENLSSADEPQTSNETDNPMPAEPRPATPQAPVRAKIESIAEFRFYNVAPEHFEIFKKDLAAEANIVSEPKATAKEIEVARQADRQLLIKVTILPADAASPSR